MTMVVNLKSNPIHKKSSHKAAICMWSWIKAYYWAIINLSSCITHKLSINSCSQSKCKYYYNDGYEDDCH